MTDETEPCRDDRAVKAETHQTFVAAAEGPADAEAPPTRAQVISSVTEKKSYAGAADADDEMPLPTDLKTVFLGGMFCLAVLTMMYLAAEIVLPIVLAVMLKLLLQPLVRVLEGIRIPRPLGAILSILLVLFVFAGTISLLAGPAASWASRLPEAIPKIRDSFTLLKQPIDSIQHLVRQAEGIIGADTGTPPPIAAPTFRPASVVGAVFSGTATVTSGLFTTLLILFYMLTSGEIFLRRVVEILPSFKDKRNAVELSFHIERDVSAYLLTVTLINVAVGLATGAVMWLCGVDSPVLWGAIAFVLNYVPFLGPMVGIVVFLMASILSFGVSWWAVVPPGLYLCIHILEGEFFTPTLLARRFTINPVAVILALVVWFWMWGVPGAILAVPMLAVTKIICDDIRPLRAVGHLLEG
ncbi:MAG TPA: AI-2E family transporter [Rhodopila sp.]|nr:AI-2E family transporter [Rhodopila sp.]